MSPRERRLSEERGRVRSGSKVSGWEDESEIGRKETEVKKSEGEACRKECEVRGIWVSLERRRMRNRDQGT